MKLDIKSAKPLQYNSMYTDYGILNNFESIPKALKFSYSRKKEINKIYIGVGVVALIGSLLVLNYLKVFTIDSQLLYCILFFVISYLFLAWYQLDKPVNYLLTETHFSVNGVQIPWKEIKQIETVTFNTGSTTKELYGLRIIAPDFDDVIVANIDINEMEFDKTDLPQIVYMFWKRGIKSKSIKNQES